jgi:thiamine biosynthesis lipoprotein
VAALMQYFEHRFVAMGGPCRLRLYVCREEVALSAITAAEAEVRRLERKYSRYLPDSLTSRINRRAGSNTPEPIDVETAGLLNYADILWRESDGLFDLTSGVLRRAWDFRSGRVPAQDDLDKLLPLVGWQRVRWDQSSIYLPKRGMELDFGGCVKEYGSDSAALTLLRYGVKHALVDLSGDMAAVGARIDGEPWRIGIRHPKEKGHAVAWVPLSAGGLASSGDYERCLKVGGRRYGHILNPQTGWPLQGLAAVSVIAEQCLVAGSSSTIAMLKPASEALDWLVALGLPWLALDQSLQCHGSLKLSLL